MDECEVEVERIHALLTRHGIPNVSRGTECMDPDCNSYLYHRIKVLLDSNPETRINPSRKDHDYLCNYRIWSGGRACNCSLKMGRDAI